MLSILYKMKSVFNKYTSKNNCQESKAGKAFVNVSSLHKIKWDQVILFYIPISQKLYDRNGYDVLSGQMQINDSIN